MLQFNLTKELSQADSTVLPSPIQKEAVSRPTAPAPQTLSTSFLRPTLGGNWEKAREFFSLHPDATSARITKGGRLHLPHCSWANKDVALHILQHMPELGIERDQNEDTILHVLARKPLAFSDNIGLGIWQRLVYAFLVDSPSHAHTTAYSFVAAGAEEYFMEFIVELIQSYQISSGRLMRKVGASFTLLSFTARKDLN
ncbi:hypothetical protein HAX54_003665 [Datura stramonium]|uniref:Uncharacterized protein n=1 Tax=Datura stramonium TaxID=4076 RepID=A0ABS8WVE7_DATST|nr:hypothetical protein [Datura stramonium]